MMLAHLRPACRIVRWFAAWWFVAVASASRADDLSLSLSKMLAGQPANSLVKRIQETRGAGDGKQPELTVDHRFRWLPQSGCLVMESQLTNRGTETVHAQQVALADWSFPTRDPADQARYQPLAYRADIWYGSTYWTGPDWTRVGKDWHHSGEQTSSIRRFDVPRDGRVTLQGRVYKADINGGDGVHVEIRVGRRVVWQADIEAADAVGVDPALTVDVRQGEAIRFVVHRRGTIGYDTTHWDPLVTYENGEAFQASRAFSTHAPGRRWVAYEMETDTNRPSQSSGPVVHGFRPQLLLYDQAVQPTQPVAVPADDSLPVWVIASGSGRQWLRALLVRRSSTVRCSAVSRTTACCVPNSGSTWPRVTATLAPGQISGPAHVHSGTVSGVLAAGLAALQRLLVHDSQLPELAAVRSALADVRPPRRNHRVTCRWAGNLTCAPWCRATGRVQDGVQDDVESYARASQQHVDRARELLTELQQAHAG